MAENWSNYEHGPNAGMLFYRRIYRQQDIIDKLRLKTDSLEFDISKEDKATPFDPFYKALFSFRSGKYSQIENSAATIRFSLHTNYPGLLVGSGYTHDSNSKGDAKIGFFFDHTTGLPVIPGSSVKGLMRSIFELDQDEKENKYTGVESLEAIRFFLAKIEAPNLIITVENLIELKNEIFGNQEGCGTDIFFDAVPDLNKTGDKPIFGNDFITPHINHEHPELSPFKSPNPIQFIKVLPGIAFEFRFHLACSKKNPLWTAEFKKKMFKAIILTMGIGAKTNVGYGQFTENYEGTVVKGKPEDSGGGPQPTPKPPTRPENIFPKEAIPHLIKNQQFIGLVSEVIGNYYIIEFDVNGFTCRYSKQKNEKLELNKGDQVRVICANTYEPGSPNISIKK